MLFLAQRRGGKGGGEGGGGGRWGSKDYEVHIAGLCHEMTNGSV